MLVEFIVEFGQILSNWNGIEISTKLREFTGSRQRKGRDRRFGRHHFAKNAFGRMIELKPVGRPKLATSPGWKVWKCRW